MHIADDSVTVNFLVYTKSASFDYQWVYGLTDKPVENALQTYVLNWLSTAHLAKLPPVTTFFRLHNHFALMIAQESKTRLDAEQRPIFQRAFLLWKPTNGLCYHHLEPLSRILKDEAEEVYSRLPNNTVRIESQVQHFTLSIPKLDKETAHLSDEVWDLPGNISWQDTVREKLTVEVPGDWDFGKMVSGLIEQPISADNMVYIGNSLYLENRNPPLESWLVSAKDLDSGAEPRIMNEGSRPLSIAELGRYKSRANADAQKIISTSSAVPAKSRAATISSHDENNSQRIIHEDGNPTDKSESSFNEALEQFFSKFSEPDLYFNKTKRSELIRFVKKVIERDRLPLVEAETRLLLLLTPATLHSYNDGNYSDVIVSWNNLLNEMLIFYHQPSEGMTKEWGRRISHLQKITIQNLSRPQRDWETQFNDACQSVQRILESL